MDWIWGQPFGMLYNQKERAANDMQAVGQPHSIVETCERKEWVEKRRLRQVITDTDTTYAH